MPTWTEAAREEALRLLNGVPHLTTPQQRRSYLYANCPYKAKEQIGPWKAMARALTAERPVVRSYDGMSEKEAEWYRKNQI